MYLLHGNLTAKAGHEAALAEILVKASQLVAAAKGCKLYTVSTDDSKPAEIWVTEIWESKEDHDQSLGAPGVRELIMQAIPLLDGHPQKGQELTVLGGFGI